jgi:hypothetical protein
MARMSPRRQAGHTWMVPRRIEKLFSDWPGAKSQKQMLLIMNQDVIKEIKVAAAQDETKLSHAVEEAVSEWLGEEEESSESQNRPPDPGNHEVLVSGKLAG